MEITTYVLQWRNTYSHSSWVIPGIKDSNGCRKDIDYNTKESAMKEKTKRENTFHKIDGIEWRILCRITTEFEVK